MCGYEPEFLSAVETVNQKQKIVLVGSIVKRFGEALSGKKFAVWGLAFKPDTEDMREAPAITIIEGLTCRGAGIVAYDPKAMGMAKMVYLRDIPSVSYVDSKYETIKAADALILVTEWKQFRQPDFDEIKNFYAILLFLMGEINMMGKRWKKQELNIIRLELL